MQKYTSENCVLCNYQRWVMPIQLSLVAKSNDYLSDGCVFCYDVVYITFLTNEEPGGIGF